MITKTQFNELVRQFNPKPSELQLFVHLFVDVCLVGACLFLIQDQSITSWIAVQFVVPILMFRMFALMHDAVHGAASASTSINNLIGIISGVFCFLPYFTWRKVHIEHHRWAGNIDKDPVMKIVKEFVQNPEKERSLISFAWNSWLPIMTLLQHLVFWSSGVSAIRGCKRNEWSYVFLSYFVPAGFYILIAPKLILLLPGIIIYFYMTEIINLPHHLRLPQYREDVKLASYDQFRIARSCDYPKFISYLVLNNFNYHTEHHMMPSLPWYRLHKVRPKIKKLLGAHYNESIGSSWIVENRSKPIKEVIVYNNEMENKNLNRVA